MKNPFFRESRVAASLLHGVAPWQACDETYGDEDDDRSDEETCLSWEHTDVDETNRTYVIYPKEMA